MNSKKILAMSLAAVFAVSMVATFSFEDIEAKKPKPVTTFLVQESEMLGELNGLYVFVDVTGKQIVGGHVAITAPTSDCDLGGPAPTNISVLAGDAGELIADGIIGSVPLTNSGLGSDAACIFHGDIDPAQLNADDGVTSVTDIVLAPSGNTEGVTVTVTAEVSQ
jgi:hypothetical protein